MRWNRKALILAPSLVPVLFSAALTVAELIRAGPGQPLAPGTALLFFLVMLVPGCIISYGTTICVFLPCLTLLSRSMAITPFRVGLLGLVLGAGVIVPLTWMEWTSSGPDSGPPEEAFLTFFARWASDPSFVWNALFPIAGLITASFYWWLATRADSA